jgi:hypothetical protein
METAHPAGAAQTRQDGCHPRILRLSLPATCDCQRPCWDVANGVGFRARWTGGSGVEDVKIELDAQCDPINEPVSLFGQGVLTFHIAGLFRTSPGWNLWVGGPPNHIEDGIAPLSGIIETDWSPYSSR